MLWVFVSCLKGCSCARVFSCVQLSAILWAAACQVPLSMGLHRQEYWSGLPLPSPEDLPDPGPESMPPAVEAWSFRHWTASDVLVIFLTLEITGSLFDA